MESDQRPNVEGSASQWWSNAARQRLGQLLSLIGSDQATINPLVLKHLDEETTAIETVLKEINSYRNGLTLIYRLPVELLARCFALLVEMEPPGLYGGRTRYNTTGKPTRTLGWIKVSHVCSLWRDIALRNSTLWRTVTFDLGLPCAEAMFSRAHSLPLNVTCRLPSSTPPLQTQIPTLIKDHLCHMERLRIDVPGEMSHSLIEGALSGPAPLLGSIDVRITSRTTDAPTDHDLSADELLAIPETFLGGHAPCLRSMLLEGAPLPPPLPIYGMLTRLFLQFPNPSPTIEALIKFLNITSALESLQLVCSLKEIPEPPPQVVHLPRLTSVSLVDSAALCRDFSRLLRIPSLYEMEWNVDDEEETEIASLTDDLITLYIPQERDLRSLKIRICWDEDTTSGRGGGNLHLQISGSYQVAPVPIVEPITTHPADISLSLIYPVEPYGDLLPTVQSMFYTQQLPASERLCFDLCGNCRLWDDGSLAVLLDGVFEIQHLTITSVPLPLQGEGFAAVFCPGEMDDQPPDDQADVFLPNLSAFTILDSKPPNDHARLAVQDNLLAAIKYRKQNHPQCVLQRVNLGSSLGVEASFVEELGRWVSSVKIIQE